MAFDKKDYMRKWRQNNKERNRDYQRAYRKKLGHKTRAEKKDERVARENELLKKSRRAIEKAVDELKKIHMRNYGRIDMEQILDNIKSPIKTQYAIDTYEKNKGISL